MARRSLTVTLLLATLTALSGCETQPPRQSDSGYHRERDRYEERGRYEERERHEERNRYREIRVVFSDRDVAYIRDYYAPRHPHGYPPGLAKKGKVPPGHAMKMRRGDPLPYDYRWQAMPRDLDERLSPLPEGYVRVIVGADIGIMNVRTRVVVDLLEGVAD